jgi:serine/threonine protein kinase
MAIEFLCSNPDCQTQLRVVAAKAGKKVRCPKCKTACVTPIGTTDSGTDHGTFYEATMVSDARAEEQTGKLESGSLDVLNAFLDRKRTGEDEPFEKQRELARGGMGAVLIGHDKAIEREVAVKVMKPQIAESEEHRIRFLEEAQVTGQLEHPNIVPIHDLGKDAEDNLYFTMKLVKGNSLGEILKSQRSGGLQAADSSSDSEDNVGLETNATMSLSELLSIFLKVCDGMAFAHSKGVIHRDLKPDNIMVGDFGEVLVMDRGLAKVLERGKSRGPEYQVPQPSSSEADAIELKETGSSPSSQENTFPPFSVIGILFRLPGAYSD